MQSFVPKTRKPKFELTLRVHDLNNVPLVSGTSFIKWHLPSSTAAEHRGRTQKSVIKDHRVQYEYEKRLPVRMTVGKDGMLQEVFIHLEVVQEYPSAGRTERIALGNIKLNLAEYVEPSEHSPLGGPEADPGVTRRYLMQSSKINSTLKIGITMRHIEGTRDYIAPPLRTAPMFGGIAGIISSSEPASTTHGVASHADSDEPASGSGAAMPNLSSATKENGEMQDMYRRTLAAYWASQPGELKADECIEDIFGGGDGWGSNGAPKSHPNPTTQTRAARGNGVNDSPNLSSDGGNKGWREGAMKGGGSSNRASLERQANTFGAHKKVKSPKKGIGEIDEFDVREDLRAWRIGDLTPRNAKRHD